MRLTDNALRYGSYPLSFGISESDQAQLLPYTARVGSGKRRPVGPDRRPPLLKP